MSRLPFRCAALVTLPALVMAAAPAVLAQVTNQAATHDKIIQFVRDRFGIPAADKVTITEPRESAFPDFLETTITVDDGKDKKSIPFFVSRNQKYLVEGNIFNLGGDPRQTIERLISLKDQATQGPANAPVTLVEYSDLECPMCAKFHEALETEIIPKYGDKLRVVFKEFPLVSIHDWALSGAIAAQCVHQIDPSKYPAFRSVVYKNQESISGDHARDMLLHFGAEAGLDNMKLAACIDSKETLARVEANMREGEALGVAQTPTSYVNGRPFIGGTPLADLYKLIDEALHDPK